MIATIDDADIILLDEILDNLLQQRVRVDLISKSRVTSLRLYQSICFLEVRLLTPGNY